MTRFIRNLNGFLFGLLVACLLATCTEVMAEDQCSSLNPTCVADGLDARGSHEAAARVRCLYVDTVYTLFPSFDQCVAAVTMKTTQPVKDDGNDDEVQKLQEQLQALIALQARSDKKSSATAAKQQRLIREDSEYAQQALEQIQQMEEPPSDQ